MAASKHHNSGLLKQTLSCGICFEPYNTHKHLPKALPCLHTFCLPCLVTLETDKSEDEKLKCPLCCDLVSLSPEGVSKLPNNIAICELLETFDSDDLLVCESHPNHDIILVCMTCNKGLCLKCVKDLSKGSHANHELEEMEASVKTVKSRLVETSRHQRMVWEKYHQKGVQQINNDTWIIRKDIGTVVENVIRTILDWREEKIAHLEKVKAEKTEIIKQECQAVFQELNEIDSVLEGIKDKQCSVGELFKVQKVTLEEPGKEIPTLSKDEFNISYTHVVDRICRADFFETEFKAFMRENFCSLKKPRVFQKPPRFQRQRQIPTMTFYNAHKFKKKGTEALEAKESSVSSSGDPEKTEKNKKFDEIVRSGWYTMPTGYFLSSSGAGATSEN